MAFWNRKPRDSAPESEERGLVWPGYPGPPSQFMMGNNPSGVEVTVDSALHNAAVWACQRLIVQTIATLKINTVRIDQNGNPKPVASPKIVDRPSVRLSRRAWTAQVVRSLLQIGNVYGQVTLDADGRPFNVETHPVDAVTWQYNAGEWVPYLDGKPQHIYPRGDLWHVPASQFMIPGQPFAMSPNDYMKTTVGMGLAGQDFIARFFGDGAHPTEIVTAPVNPTREQAQAVKAALMNAWKGTREPAVLGKDWTYTQNPINFSETQVIELLRFVVEDTARFYGCPPAMVYVAMTGQKITYQNVSQEDLQYLKHSVTMWLVDVEDAWSTLLTMPGGVIDSRQVMFDPSTILRMDDMGRAQLHTTQLANHETSVNQIMIAEGKDPWPDEIYNKPGLPVTAGAPAAAPIPAPSADPHSIS